MSVAATGDTVYAYRGAEGSRKAGVWRIPLDGSASHRVLGSVGPAWTVAVSPDERSFASGYFSPQENSGQRMLVRFDLGRMVTMPIGTPLGFDAAGRYIFLRGAPTVLDPRKNRRRRLPLATHGAWDYWLTSAGRVLVSPQGP